MDYKRLVEDNLPLVDSVVRTIAHRNGLSADEEDELGSSVKLKLVENDYEVLRKFEGRSQLRTYLITVVQRHFLDDRNARWGKWRPSAIARRRGPVAILLDQLLTRDHRTFDDAAAAIAAQFGDAVPRAELEKIAMRLPVRSSRKFVDDEELEHLPAPAPDGDAIEARERRRIGDRVEHALADVLRDLSDEDRAILRLRFCENVKIGRIAELIGVPTGPPRKRFYRRLDDLMDSLRKALQARGVSAQDVVSIVEHSDFEIDEVIDQAGRRSGKSPERPSVP